jgi:hypothetical protein
MNFFKRLTGKSVSKSSECCGVKIKEVENNLEESRAGRSNDANTSYCTTISNEQKSYCC